MNRAVFAAAIALVLAGCTTRSEPVPVPSSFPGAVPVTLSFAGGLATATLTDTPEARQFAAMLPATVDLRDVWGQAKSGRLPRTIAVESGRPTHDPVPGELYFWPRTDVIAIYYDDLDQRVPDPGLVRLGIVDTGLADLADAGRTVTVRIELRAPGRD
ncbi:hypothetical protein Ais01nite_72390 [Asanoa ishikariensis]|uniref:Cyclophilin-like domain-containing protein n=1 Tax=Asanoa ishikariensis TaxID=137265 RepID=A0A1H3URW6_9ACTN|nr:cyclophilin-like fold protein [Asanoa ishikariensis]GIF69204.1 hypothetical protein Ais01nite_72390 [Asanoa ishikariensis]SDZ64519.1 hypothetical protein SAMN05421684_7773 [Asanoa ishikariensis]